MNEIASFETLPRQDTLGSVRAFVLRVNVTVEDGSFLHIGGTPSRLSEMNQPIFAVDGQPVIPASSFKGAFRQQLELLFIKERQALAKDLGLSNQEAELLKPSIPAPNPSKAEQDLFARGYRREVSEIKIDERTVHAPRAGICPVSYFFGAAGLEGFLRIPNLFPKPGQWKIEQTRIRIDRQAQTAAKGAIVSVEQVKPGAVFQGDLLVLEEKHGSKFGDCRIIGGSKIDLWLAQWPEQDKVKRQLLFFNRLLLPALSNLLILGGLKTLGAGRVKVTLEN